MKTGDTSKFAIDIVSDTICPWCYIAKRRLDTVLRDLESDHSFAVSWRPFELNADMPREGMDRKAYRSEKFGSWERSLELDAQVKQAALSDDLEFHHERMERTPNTLASHVLIRLAGDHGIQTRAVEALFKAYFVDGRDVGHTDVLTEIGEACGLEPSKVASALANDGLRLAVAEEAREFAVSGIRGVPSVLVNRFVLFSGALRPELMADKIRTAFRDERVIAASSAGQV